VIQQSMSLKYEPSSEPLHISAKWSFVRVCSATPPRTWNSSTATRPASAPKATGYRPTRCRSVRREIERARERERERERESELFEHYTLDLEYGICKTVSARFWPWLEPFCRWKSSRYFKLFPLERSATRPASAPKATGYRPTHLLLLYHSRS